MSLVSNLGLKVSLFLIFFLLGLILCFFSMVDGYYLMCTKYSDHYLRYLLEDTKLNQTLTTVIIPIYDIKIEGPILFSHSEVSCVIEICPVISCDFN